MEKFSSLAKSTWFLSESTHQIPHAIRCSMEASAGGPLATEHFCAACWISSLSAPGASFVILTRDRILIRRHAQQTIAVPVESVTAVDHHRDWGVVLDAGDRDVGLFERTEIPVPQLLRRLVKMLRALVAPVRASAR